MVRGKGGGRSGEGGGRRHEYTAVIAVLAGQETAILTELNQHTVNGQLGWKCKLPTAASVSKHTCKGSHPLQSHL